MANQEHDKAGGGVSGGEGTPRAERYAVGRLQIIYDTGEGFWSGSVRDASESGIFVLTQHELPIGTRVTLLPETPDEAELPFEVFAEVVRVDVYDVDNHFDRDPGIAFRLVNLTREHAEQFRAFLARYGVPVRRP
jgi:hypothetical protein